MASTIQETSPDSADLNQGEPQGIGPAGRLRAIFLNPVTLALILIAINLLVFYRSLGAYFLADDYMHVAYLARVFEGNPHLLLENFYSNWLQTQGTQFYRPFISVTLALDYLIWQANAPGFHLTNILYQAVSSVFLFLIARQMLGEYGRTRSTLAGFFAGALFAAFPLHTEVVSWIIGRVDGVCTAFYLLSFFLFLKSLDSKSGYPLGFSLAGFGISLLSKEMAVTLPPALSLYCFIKPPPGTAFRKRFRISIHDTWPFWLMVFLYLIGRTAALGTISGGYLGSIGEGLTGSFYKRWISDGSLARVMLPFNMEVFHQGSKLITWVKAVYALSGLYLLLRIVTPRMPSGVTRYMIFAAGWCLLSVVPTYQVWNLTASLQGSRFAYLATAPLCLLIVLAIFPMIKPDRTDRINTHKRIFGFATIIIPIALLAVLTFLFCQAAYKNNLPWAHAGSEVRALRQNIETTLGAGPVGSRLILLNLPQRNRGAHMLYNAAMLGVLLSPPLTGSNLAEKVFTFEPMTYGDTNLIVVSRLRRLAESKDSYRPFKWDRQSRQLVPLALPFHILPDINLTGGEAIELENVRSDQSLLSPEIVAPALSYDFVEIILSASASGSKPEPNANLILYWRGKTEPDFPPARFVSQSLVPDGKAHTYRFPVSQYKDWIMTGVIEQLKLKLPAGPYRFKILDASVRGSGSLIPSLSWNPDSAIEDRDGVLRLTSDILKLEYDCSRLAGAKSAIVEISKPDSWFEHYSGELRDRMLSNHSMKTLQVNNLCGSYELPVQIFPQAGYYQVRIAAIDESGKVVGYVSDPLNLQLSAKQIHNAN